MVESHSQEHVVGTSVPRVDAPAKVTGRAVFITDLQIPGMAYAKLWRSPLPHAHIRNIDTSVPLASPGVLAMTSFLALPTKTNRFSPSTASATLVNQSPP